MNINKLFGQFPILENDKILLRPVIESDLLSLTKYLNELDVSIEYSLGRTYNNLNEVYNDFIYVPNINFNNGAQIMWAIIDKENNEIIGVRDCWFDAVDKPVTVQGFISKLYRNKGFSKAAYKLIINFLNNCAVRKLVANTSFENFSAVSLLYSLGFYQIEIATFLNESLRIVFECDIEDDFSGRNFKNSYEKRIHLFCKMYLNAGSIAMNPGHKITENNIENDAWYVIVESEQIYNDYKRNGRMKFLTDGKILMDVNDSDLISYIGGEDIKFIDAWHYCWNICLQ